MNYLKRFSDFCAGFAAFAASLYILRKFMSFNPADAEGIKEKARLFFSKDYFRDYRAYLILIILLAVSVIIGIILERLPYVGFAFSLAPMLQILLMLGEGKLYERPMLYVILGTVHVVGNIVYSLSLDREDGKRRAFICANIFGAALFSLGIWVWRRASQLSLLGKDKLSELNARDTTILLGLEDDSEKLIIGIAVFILISVAVSLILRDVYFIDALIAAVPFVYSVYLFASGKLTVFPQAVFFLTLFYFLFRIFIVIFEPMAKKCDCK